MKEKEKSAFRTKCDSIIFDNVKELYNIVKLMTYSKIYNIQNRFRLCYRAEDNNLNFTEAYYKCKLQNDVSFVLVYQTYTYQRYGIFIPNQKEISSFTFSINNDGIVSGKVIENLDLSRKQSSIYIINLIKKNKDNKEENSFDSMSNINDLEIFLI